MSGCSIEKERLLDDVPSIAIIVLSWNSKALLKKCLSTLTEKTDYSNYHTIVVDNGSSNESVAWIKEEFPCVDTIALDRNFGFSIGNNKGIAYAIKNHNPRYVLLLNNDTEIIQENWLRKLVLVAESNKSIGIVGSKLIYPDGTVQYIGTKLDMKGLSWLKPQKHPNLPEIYEVDGVLGACFLIKREVIEKIGGLDSGFTPYGHEESDFCVRAKRAGYKICMVFSVVIIHLNKASMSRVNSQYLHTMARKNQIRFMLLNFPVTWLVKRLPYESVIRCFITRNKASAGGIPIKLRNSKDMFFEVKSNFKALTINIANLSDIINKRQNRTMKLPLQ